MSKRKKTLRFAETKAMNNIVQGGEEEVKKALSSWLVPGREVIVELGCGSGSYTLGLARLYPEKLCVGVDIQGERLWYGAKEALAEGLNNVVFLRTYVDWLNKFFPPHSITEMWITFPDPYPRVKQEKKRLTSSKFLEMYRGLIVPGGKLHLKTDNTDLYEYSLESIGHAGGKIFQCLPDVEEKSTNPELNIRTYFERKHRAAGKKISYASFKL